MAVKIAQVLDDFDFTLDNQALNETNYQDYYVVTKEGRGEDPTTRLIKKIKKLKDRDLKILFSGFKGCGKSTELFRVKLEVEQDFLVRIFSVRERLDANNLTISEILITVMTDLFQFVHQYYQDIQLSHKLIENIENWANSIYKEEIKYKYFTGKFASGVDVNVGLGKILNIFAKLGLDFNAGRKFKEITKKDVNQTLSELIMNCNLLLFEIKSQLPKIGKQNIIFIIEDLEKVELGVAEGLFYNYAKQLTAISCCFIYTFPISLVYHPHYNVILNEFDENLTLPMIKVHEKDGTDHAPGLNTILHILNKRIHNTDHLVSPELLKEFIRMSGGCLRDLFRMLKMAADNAMDREKQSIEPEDFEYSLNKLKNDYYNTISYNGQTGVTANDYYQILVDCCNSVDKKPVDVKGLMDLKHNMCILGYNGKNWYDVHPVVKEILKEKNLIR